MSESEAVSPQILPIHSAADMRLNCGFLISRFSKICNFLVAIFGLAVI